MVLGGWGHGHWGILGLGHYWRPLGKTLGLGVVGGGAALGYALGLWCVEVAAFWPSL